MSLVFTQFDFFCFTITEGLEGDIHAFPEWRGFIPVGENNFFSISPQFSNYSSDYKMAPASLQKIDFQACVL
jgi:hypothetical protein